MPAIALLLVLTCSSWLRLRQMRRTNIAPGGNRWRGVIGHLSAVGEELRPRRGWVNRGARLQEGPARAAEAVKAGGTRPGPT